MRSNVDDFEGQLGSYQPKKTPVKSAPGQVKNAAAEKAPPKKKKSGAAVIAVIIAAVIALFGVSYYFNIMDTKTKVVRFFLSQDDAYSKAQQAQASANDVIAQKQAELDSRTNKLDQRKKDLDARASAIASQETAASDKQTSDDAKAAELKKMVELYAGMEPAAAANIFVSINSPGWAASLLSQMDVKKAGAILAAMDPKFAGSISVLMVPK